MADFIKCHANIRGVAHLLMGMMEPDSGNYDEALSIFDYIKPTYKACLLETYDKARLHIKNFNDQRLLNYCRVAQDLYKSLQRLNKPVEHSKFHDKDIKVMEETLWLYDIEGNNEQYSVSKFGLIWLDLKKCQNKGFDSDGMMCLDYKKLIKSLCKHFMDLSSKWLLGFEKKSNLHKTWKLNDDLFQKKSPGRIAAEEVEKYIEICEWLKKKFNIEVLNCMDVDQIRSSSVVSKSLSKRTLYAVEHLHSLHGNEGIVCIDSWLKIWELNCMSSSPKNLSVQLQKLENSSENNPHIFRSWLTSCENILESRFMLASKTVLHDFLGTVVQSNHFSISIQNVVNILTLHCMSLFAVLTLSRAVMKAPIILFVPQSYLYIVKLFNKLNHTHIVALKRMDTPTDPLSLYKDSIDLLRVALGHLTGCSNEYNYSALKCAFSTSTESISTQQCLVLALTLLANLSIIPDQSLDDYRIEMSQIIRKANIEHNYTGKAVEELKKPFIQPLDVFKIIEEMQESAFGCIEPMVQICYNCNNASIQLTPIEKTFLQMEDSNWPRVRPLGPSRKEEHSIQDRKISPLTPENQSAFTGIMDERPSAQKASSNQPLYSTVASTSHRELNQPFASEFPPLATTDIASSSSDADIASEYSTTPVGIKGLLQNRSSALTQERSSLNEPSQLSSIVGAKESTQEESSRVSYSSVVRTKESKGVVNLSP